jgi:hypothetical protein
VYNNNTKWHVYGRPDGSKLTGKKYGEIFAQSFYPIDLKNHEEKLFYIIDLYKNKIIKRCIGWEHYRAMQNVAGSDLNLHKIYNDFFIIDDWTDDFDSPNDYENFIKNWKNKNQF